MWNCWYFKTPYFGLQCANKYFLFASLFVYLKAFWVCHLNHISQRLLWQNDFDIQICDRHLSTVAGFKLTGQTSKSRRSRIGLNLDWRHKCVSTAPPTCHTSLSKWKIWTGKTFEICVIIPRCDQNVQVQVFAFSFKPRTLPAFLLPSFVLSIQRFHQTASFAFVFILYLSLPYARLCFTSKIGGQPVLPHFLLPVFEQVFTNTPFCHSFGLTWFRSSTMEATESRHARHSGWVSLECRS